MLYCTIQIMVVFELFDASSDTTQFWNKFVLVRMIIRDCSRTSLVTSQQARGICSICRTIRQLHNVDGKVHLLAKTQALDPTNPSGKLKHM